MKAGITRQALRESFKFNKNMFVFIGQTFEDSSIKYHTCDRRALNQGLVNGYILGMTSPKGNVKRFKPFYYHK